MVRLLFLSMAFLVLSFTVRAQHYEDEIRKSIFFGGGSYYIDEGQIKELYYWLDSIPNLLEKFDIHLISHTDPIGGKEYNEWLSKMRSQAVEQVILKRGDINQRKISIKDWGLDNPVYSNQTFQGMQMNRRVDVILYPIIF
jgi:outer membrane protein OmpA-like peptidoglycan-associated protein